MMYKAGGFIAGSALGAGFVCTMDDLIYTQLRRNIVLPFKQMIYGATSGKQVSLDDLFELSSGTANFVSQFKPHALGRQNARALIVNDKEYATPNDHYFGYINKKQGITTKQEKQDELQIMNKLGLEVYLPPTFNLETAEFDEPKLLDEKGQVLNEDEMDIFELAQRRRSRVSDLRVMLTEDDQREGQKSFQAGQTGQKHTKKEYEKLKNFSIQEVVMLAKEQKQFKRFEDDSLNGIVKVEKKKTFKKGTKAEQKVKEELIKRMLESPQDINYERAMEMYEEQPLEAKDITLKEKRRLRRLKRKASQIDEADVKQATNIKFETQENGTSIVDTDNLDSVIR